MCQFKIIVDKHPELAVRRSIIFLNYICIMKNVINIEAQIKDCINNSSYLLDSDIRFIDQNRTKAIRKIKTVFDTMDTVHVLKNDGYCVWFI